MIDKKFHYSNYDGEHYFTNNIKENEKFYYTTYLINDKNRKEIKLKLTKGKNKYKSCNECPLIRYYCGGINCCCIINKIE